MGIASNLILSTEARASNASSDWRQNHAAALQTLFDGQIAAAKSASSALPKIELAAQVAASAVRKKHSLFYIGAGSSGLMAIADGLELPGTFGIPRDQLHLVIAGGQDSLSNIVGTFDELDAQADIEACEPSQGDCAILVSASGSTPYTLDALGFLQSHEVTCIGIANNPDSPLLKEVDVAIYLGTPPEPVAGSTRMGAGTAQKIALNMFSTLVGVQLGHVYKGHMVNLVADNEKLKQRAGRIVSDIANCTYSEAVEHLGRSGGLVKVAILLASGAEDTNVAMQLLSSNDGFLDSAMTQLVQNQHK